MFTVLLLVSQTTYGKAICPACGPQDGGMDIAESMVMMLFFAKRVTRVCCCWCVLDLRDIVGVKWCRGSIMALGQGYGYVP